MSIYFERTKDPVTGEYYYRTCSAEESAAMARLAGQVAVAERRVVLAAKAVRATVDAGQLDGWACANEALEAAVSALIELEAAK